jgi:hypothetical protein
MKHSAGGGSPRESRQNLLEEKRFQLARRAGQERDDLVALL